MSEDAVEKIAAAKTEVVYNVSADLKCPEPLKKVAEGIGSQYNDSLERISILNDGLVKCASVFTDKTSVDSILALGLVNKKNVLEFVELVPTYEYVVSSLSKLLITSRLGLQSIPEEAIREAMHGLAEVIFMLRRLGNLAKK